MAYPVGVVLGPDIDARSERRLKSIELEVRNPSGLHARPAALFVKTAASGRSRVRVANLARDGGDVDARSILGVLSLGVSSGTRIRLTVEGEDEAELAETLRRLIEGGLGESPAC